MHGSSHGGRATSATCSFCVLTTGRHMTAELKKESPQGCRSIAARSVGSNTDGESSRRLFYVEPETMAPEHCLHEQAEPTDNQEDTIVRELALRAMTHFRERLNMSDLVQGVSSETRSDGEFTITSSAMLPCTAHEITHVLSPDNTDRWNATMVEIFGNDYGYGVTVRSIPKKINDEQPWYHHQGSDEDAHLSIKVVHFSGLIPLLSKKTTTLFLDYIEVLTDPNHSDLKTWRVVQSLERDESGVLHVSDVLAGYYIEEHREAQHTQLCFLALHSAVKVRDHTVQRLQKLASLVNKAADLALRRRLGAQRLVDPPRSASGRSSITRSFASLSSSASASASGSRPPPTGLPEGEGTTDLTACTSCEDSLTSFLKRKRFCRVCGQLVCGSCVSTHEVECRIGFVVRVPVCTPCIKRLQREAFALVSYDECHDVQ